MVAGRPRTGTRSINSSFSYPLDEVKTIEDIEVLARRKGISVSNLIVQLFKEELQRDMTMRSADPNPLGIPWNHVLEQQKQEQQQPIITQESVIDAVIKSLNEINVRNLNELEVNRLQGLISAKKDQLAQRWHEIQRNKVLRRKVNEEPQTIVKGVE